MLAAFDIHANGRNQRKIREFLAVQIDRCQFQAVQTTLQKLLQTQGTGGLILPGDGTLLDAIPFTQIV
jgi:hypothetical protein